MTAVRTEDTAEREITLQVSDVPDIPADHLMRSTYGIRVDSVRLEFTSDGGAPWELSYVNVYGTGLLKSGKPSTARDMRRVWDNYRADSELMPGWLRRLALEWTPETAGTPSTEQHP